MRPATPVRARTLAAVAVTLSLGLACARATTEGARRYVEPGAEIPRPPVVLVYRFALDADDVALDTLGMRDATQEEISSEGRAVQNQLALQIVADLNERGISAQRGMEAVPVPINAFLIKGQFVTIDQGSRVRRMVIGFGSGSESLQTQVQVYRNTPDGKVRIAAAEVNAEGNRMPGMAGPLAVGAATGNVARAAVISGGMNVAQEVTGGLGQAINNISAEIADRAEAFYREKGWL